MSANVTLHAGHDVAYFTRGQGRGGCAGAMSYYTAAGEPPGEWAGKGAAALGLTGTVDPDIIERLYQENIGPGGELLVRRRQSRPADQREQAAVAAHMAAHPYASAAELAEVRAAERGKDPRQVPYFDLTVSAVKSVSVLHASYRVAARQARDRGDQDRAAVLDARADQIEAALMDSAREAVAWLERHATYTRTGHHSARTGEWRDGAGLAASLFLHHLSRDGDPQLHVHVAIWNRVQRADGADQKWRTLDSRSLHNQRLAVASVGDRILETKLSALGCVMVSRADGNGAEVGGVSQDVRDLFSSRAVAVTGELDRLAREYQGVHGKPPSRRTLWLLHQQAGQNTRRTKAEGRRTIAGQTGAAEPTAAQRLAAWEAQTARREVQALSAVHEQVAQFAAGRAAHAPAVLDDAAKRTAARIAVAEVQKLHAVWSMAQLRFEVHRALPVLEAGADGQRMVTEVAKLAVSGRAGTEVVQVTAPDITDVTSLGMRASDGGSIYRPPNEERYCTLAHLDTEEQILTAAKRTVPQLVDGETARAAAARTGLNAEQRATVVMMLTATTATTVLVAPAGAGKSHTMAEFARLWTSFTGRRVIGLTTSTNAARVLANEGLAESYNIAQFLGKTEGSDELRRPVPLHRDDVLVLDEASQLATADLAMIEEAARQAGARVIATGDTAQLGAVEAGGMFRLLAREVPAAQLHEVRRFDAAWEREASIRLRDGDLAAMAAYDRHGRMRGADEQAAYDRAASMWLADHLRGKDVLLLAGSNTEAAELSRRVQARLAQLGAVGPPQAPLSDGNQAVSPMPHRGNPELEAMRRAVFAALEIRDEADIIRSLDRGELEARALQGQHAQAAAPPDVSRQLRLTAQAETDARQQAVGAQTQHDHTAAASATTLAAQLAAEHQRLEAANARYEQWSANTHATRDAAGKATAELRRRGPALPDNEPSAQPEAEPQSMAGSRQQLARDAESVNCAEASERQAASNTADPWPSQRVPNMYPPSASESELRTNQENEPAHENRAVRLDKLLARADQAAQRIAAQKAERQASSQYAARMELEAQTQAEAGQQAEARDDVELELLRRSLSTLPNEAMALVDEIGKTLCMDFVAGVFAQWLLEQLADVGRNRLVTFLLGDEQERALRSAAATTIGLTAKDFCPADEVQAEHLAMVSQHDDPVHTGMMVAASISPPSTWVAGKP